jgi:hypothetical protein
MTWKNINRSRYAEVDTSTGRTQTWKGHDPPFENNSCTGYNKSHYICFYLSFPSAALTVTAGNSCWSTASEQIIIYGVLAQRLTWYRTWRSANCEATPCLRSAGMSKTNQTYGHRPEVSLIKGGWSKTTVNIRREQRNLIEVVMVMTANFASYVAESVGGSEDLVYFIWVSLFKGKHWLRALHRHGACIICTVLCAHILVPVIK